MPRKKLNKLKFKQTWLSPNWYSCFPFIALMLLVWIEVVVAQNPPSIEQRLSQLEQSSQNLRVVLDTIWVVFASTLVFFMNAGFAMVETGFCRQKNAVNMLSKNIIVFAIATVAFWAIGFALMFGDGNLFFGTNGFFLSGADNSPATNTAYKGIFYALSWAGLPLGAKFLFQLVFAGTAATIVSGAIAERLKFTAFLIFSLLLVGFAYPITGHWIWGKGWLSDLKFWDFAGSTVVHTKSALITPFVPEVFSFFCYLPFALCLVSTKKGVVNPDLVSLGWWLGWFNWNLFAKTALR